MYVMLSSPKSGSAERIIFNAGTVDLISALVDVHVPCILC